MRDHIYDNKYFYILCIVFIIIAETVIIDEKYGETLQKYRLWRYFYNVIKFFLICIIIITLIIKSLYYKIFRIYDYGLFITLFERKYYYYNDVFSYKNKNDFNIDFNNYKDLKFKILELFYDEKNSYKGSFTDNNKRKNCFNEVKNIIDSNKYFSEIYYEDTRSWSIIFSNNIFDVITIINYEYFKKNYKKRFFLTTQKLEKENNKPTFNDLIDKLLDDNYIDEKYIETCGSFKKLEDYKNEKNEKNEIFEFYIRTFEENNNSKKQVFKNILTKINPSDYNKPISNYHNIVIKLPEYCFGKQNIFNKAINYF